MAGRPGRSPPQPAVPARKGKPGQGRKPGKATLLGRVFARPGVIVAGATFAAVMTGILANALLMQKGHHPSPLFSPPPAEVSATAPSRPAVPVPPPAPRQAIDQPAAPAAADDTAAATDVSPAPAPPPPVVGPTKKAASHPAGAHTAVAGQKAGAVAHQDLIGQLLSKQDAKLR